MSELAINVEHISKVYKLYRGKVDRLKDALHIGGKKNYQEYHALSDVSFEVKRGETVGLVGTNGAGKSTLLKTITCVLTQSAGQIEVNGKISALLELGAGFNMEYTGLENIYFNGTLLGYTKEQITNLRGMHFGVKSLEKRQNELIQKLFPEAQGGVNATRLVVRALELRILDIDNLQPDVE